MTKVFGIGWAKTGTTTLGKCFEMLGYKHKSQDLGLVKSIATGDLSGIIKLAEKYETFEDWPWIILFKELDEAFPGSRFVLTKRSTENWIRSYSNMLSKQKDASEELNEIRRTLYGLPFPNVSENELIDRYESHNRDVERYFFDRPGDLLTVNWEQGDGWEVLCSFLGRDTPNEPFPHANRGNYQDKSAFGRIRRGLKRWAKQARAES